MLEQAYARAPHAPGLELELANAYTALDMPDAALAVLKSAVKNTPNDMTLNAQLGTLLISKGHYSTGLTFMKTAIGLCPGNNLSDKGTMALQMAIAYQKLNNKSAFKEWLLKAKIWAPKDSEVYGQANLLTAR